MKRKRRRARVHYSDPEIMAAQHADPSLDRFVDERIDWPRPLSLISGKRKTALFLRFFRDMPYKQIGTHFNVSSVRARALVLDGLSKLRNIMCDRSDPRKFLY